MRLTKARLIALAIMIITVLFFALFVVSRRSTKADFSHFKSSQELQHYFETRLSVGAVTVKQVEDWLITQGVTDCNVFENSLASDTNGEYKTVDTRIRCTVSAPFEQAPNISLWESILQQLIISWEYELDFIFENDLLDEIRVWKSSTGF